MSFSPLFEAPARERRSAPASRDTPLAVDHAATPRRRVRSAAVLAPPRCAVCHSADLIHDEVFDGAVLQMGTCRHCEHRWTTRPTADPAGRPGQPMVFARSAAVGRRRREGGASAA